MNELIQQLALQAGIQDNPDQEGLDLFAELIVQECINACGSDFGTELIKKHFGVN
jgi:hypothetical protein